MSDQQTSTVSSSQSSARTRRVLKWIVVGVAVVFFFAVLRQALFPYGEKDYIEISHGDHAHYVPRDKDPDVSVSNFPTQPPGPDERITPDGRVVPRGSTAP